MKRFKNFDTFKKYIIKNPIPDFAEVEGIEYEMKSYDSQWELIEFESIEKHMLTFDNDLHKFWFDIQNKNRYESKKDTTILEYIY